MFRALLVFSLATVLFSCSSDKNEEGIQLSQEQLDALVGTWTLVEFNVSPPQDVNNDETASENLLEEMDCLSGSLVLSEDFTWSLSVVQLSVTPITGGAFGIACSSTNNSSGDWLFLDNEVFLSEGAAGTFQLSGTTLIRTPGENLPGVRELVYQKQ